MKISSKIFTRLRNKFLVRGNNKHYYEEREDVVAWKARWAGRLIINEDNVKSIGVVKR